MSAVGELVLRVALEVATGKVTAAMKPRHRHSEFLAFLKQIDRAYPVASGAGELHLVMDNYAAHKHDAVKARSTPLGRTTHRGSTRADPGSYGGRPSAQGDLRQQE